MSKIEFNWVRMKNFLSIKDEVIFDFKRHKGLNYIFGHSLDSKDGTKNGVGKSVIFCDAITFGLFGRTSKDISKPNIPYRAIGKKCEVGINFNIGNDEFDIVQNINPTSLTLMKNGVNITKSSISETQKYIEEEVLKTTYNIFKTSVILSINDTVNIFTLKAKEKREFIDSIFNLQQYGDMYIKITEDLKKNKSNINTKLSEHRRLSDVISDLTTSIDTNKQKNSNRINEINDKISVIDESPRARVARHEHART